MKNTDRADNFEDLSGQFSVSYTESAEAPRKNYHIHDAYEVTLVLSDGVVLDVNDESYPVPYGSLLLFNTVDLHRIRYTGGDVYRRWVIWFKHGFLRESEQTVCGLLRCFFARGFERACLLTPPPERVAELCAAYQKIKDTANTHSYMQSELLSLVLAQFLIEVNDLYLKTHQLQGNTEDAASSAVYRAILYIGENFAKDVSRTTLARMLGMTERRLCDEFRRVTGQTTAQYILSVRIAAACAFLIRGMSVTEVCEKTGFENWSNFSRTFRHHVGMSPKQYAMHNRQI